MKDSIRGEKIIQPTTMPQSLDATNVINLQRVDNADGSVSFVIADSTEIVAQADTREKRMAQLKKNLAEIRKEIA